MKRRTWIILGITAIAFVALIAWRRHMRREAYMIGYADGQKKPMQMRTKAGMVGPFFIGDKGLWESAYRRGHADAQQGKPANVLNA